MKKEYERRMKKMRKAEMTAGTRKKKEEGGDRKKKEEEGRRKKRKEDEDEEWRTKHMKKTRSNKE